MCILWTFSEVQNEPQFKVGLEVGQEDIKKPIVFKKTIGYLILYGGEAGIRTLGGDYPSTVFKTAAFGRSATSPYLDYYIQHGVFCNINSLFKVDIEIYEGYYKVLLGKVLHK